MSEAEILKPDTVDDELINQINLLEDLQGQIDDIIETSNKQINAIDDYINKMLVKSSGRNHGEGRH